MLSLLGLSFIIHVFSERIRFLQVYTFICTELIKTFAVVLCTLSVCRCFSICIFFLCTPAPLHTPFVPSLAPGTAFSPPQGLRDWPFPGAEHGLPGSPCSAPLMPRRCQPPCGLRGLCSSSSFSSLDSPHLALGTLIISRLRCGGRTGRGESAQRLPWSGSQSVAQPQKAGGGEE